MYKEKSGTDISATSDQNNAEHSDSNYVCLLITTTLSNIHNSTNSKTLQDRFDKSEIQTKISIKSVYSYYK